MPLSYVSLYDDDFNIAWVICMMTIAFITSKSSLVPLVEGVFAQEGLSRLFIHATDITLMHRSTITVRPVGVCMT